MASCLLRPIFSDGAFFLSRRSTALELLGGPEAVSACLSSSSEEKLFLGTSLHDRVFSQFLPSTPSRASGLAVRIERRKSGRVTLTILGRVEQLHTFDGLADFYYAPPSRARKPTDFRQLLLSHNAPASSSLFIPPPLFCRFSQPANYRLDQLSVAPPSSPKGEAATAVARALGVSAVPWLGDSPGKASAERLAAASVSPSSSPSAAPGSKTVLDREDDAGEDKLGTQRRRREDASCASQGLDAEGEAASEGTEDGASTSGEESRDGGKTGDATGETEWPRTKAQRSEDEKRVGEEFNSVARFGDAQVPSLPPPAAMKATADELLLSRLRHLLVEHPIWLRSSLDARLPEEFTAWRKKPAYAKSCFLFADGPWRGCLCRLGYDPRLHAESRFSQTIDFRDAFFRNVNWRRLRNRRTPGSLCSLLPLSASPSAAQPGSAPPEAGEELCGSLASLQTAGKNVAHLEQHFLIAPTRPSVLYQLREIQDEGVQKLLKDAPVLTSPCKETGWFTAATMKTLRELLAMKSQRMREKGDLPATA
ncbi:hypothetical protein NCLIV_029270 [Neospora caninum Liverpool]|uniref:Uncharacterized protein n=1 Tax=Neospora caninum (strain Liverpool) TaxID=572307 RepID=F0VHE6_NEOCL|nr:hypothetical protein NCLIV_029270 [Neospora caninum Liverpool]CBZ53140.1 hypothetical protein NCLIV_029270 [Neospora caninum Liverpool]|eukprot:XP_003883172.1 hypothetical protein NCLIV_029270 [Neospora caninum Liverpool]